MPDQKPLLKLYHYPTENGIPDLILVPTAESAREGAAAPAVVPEGASRESITALSRITGRLEVEVAESRPGIAVQSHPVPFVNLEGVI